MVHKPSRDHRVSLDPSGYPPSQYQNDIGIAYGTTTGYALVVWQDYGHYAPLDTDRGIWGRLWVPFERTLLPLAFQDWP
jgi:hypothetical protein